MLLKRIFFGFLLFSFFMTNNEVHAAQAEDMEDQRPRNYLTFTPSQQLLYFYEAYRASEEDCITEFQQSSYKMKDAIIGGIRRFQELFSPIIRRLDLALYDNEIANNILKDVLKIRYDYLASLSSQTERIANHISTFRCSPGDEAGFLLYSDSEFRKVTNECERKTVILNMSRYQFLNRIIHHLVDLINIENLTDENRFILRTCKAIQPFLAREIEDPGHPYLAIGRVESMDAVMPGSPFNPANDYSLYSLCIEKGKKPDTKGFIYDLGQRVFLPFPAWLVKTTKQEITPTMESEFNIEDAVAFIDGPRVPKKSAKKKPGRQKNRAEQRQVLPEAQEVSETAAAAAVPMQEEFQQVKILEVRPSEALPEAQEVRKVAAAAIQEEHQQAETLRAKSYVAPAGIRKFRQDQLMIDVICSIEDLNSKQQGQLEALFSHDRFQKLKWSDIRSLWHAINGRKTESGEDTIQEDKGGSHKALRNREGKIVGGTFAHSDAHTYTSRTIRYVRDAFWTIGYGPK